MAIPPLSRRPYRIGVAAQADPTVLLHRLGQRNWVCPNFYRMMAIPPLTRRPYRIGVPDRKSVGEGKSVD